MAQASGREIYVIGNEEDGNREMIIIEDGVEHDLPAAAEVTYADERSRFPYNL